MRTACLLKASRRTISTNGCDPWTLASGYSHVKAVSERCQCRMQACKCCDSSFRSTSLSQWHTQHGHHSVTISCFALHAVESRLCGALTAVGLFHPAEVCSTVLQIAPPHRYRRGRPGAASATRKPGFQSPVLALFGSLSGTCALPCASPTPQRECQPLQQAPRLRGEPGIATLAPSDARSP